jgi:hypothetical protein
MQFGTKICPKFEYRKSSDFLVTYFEKSVFQMLDNSNHVYCLKTIPSIQLYAEFQPKIKKNTHSLSNSTTARLCL